MFRPLTIALLASSALIPAIVGAQSLPTGGTVQAGAATIGPAQGNALAITQTSDRAVINWQGFSIGEGGRVDITQPGSGAALLNRVTGGASSTIAGQLNANGQVYLVNPNGILITKTGSVNAAGFVASTLDLTDRQFMDGEIVVTGKGGTVSNQGRIAIVKGGYAALIGGRVDNAGTIVAPLGKVALGAGTRATLDLTGDGFLQVAVPQSGGGIGMSGRIVADGGAVLLSAAQAVGAARSTVNLTGVIEAKGVEGHDGAVTLTGGDITLAGADINVSGAAGGGTVRVGGDRQGDGMLAHADTLTVDAASTIRADATGTGTGGDVVLWSDRATRFAGTIRATGAGGGNGGQAEVSGKVLLDYTGVADLRGAAFGTLLLDPYNVTISTAADSNQKGFIATGNDSVINSTTLLTALGTANVTVSTGNAGSPGAQAGTIVLAAGTPLAWSTGATLTLQAAGGVTLNSAINAAAGGLTISAATIATMAADLSVARFTLASGNWIQNAAVLPGFATADFRIVGGSFLRAGGGAGTIGNPYKLTDIYGAQGAGSSATLRAATYQLAGDIDASGTATWNGGAGFVPLGGAGANFIGTLDGAGYAISGLVINRPGSSAGLFGQLGSAGAIRNLALIGASITGGQDTGGIAGQSDGSISRVSVAGSVSGQDFVGGAVGQGSGTVSQAVVAASVTGSGDNIGGIVGYNRGTLTQSVMTGATSGTNNVGGVTGLNDDIVDAVYGTGPVTGSGDRVGGLVGYQATGTLSNGYASGLVSAGGAGVGGIAGAVAGSIVNTFWDQQTTGQSNAVAGGSYAGTTGLTTAQARTSAAYAGFDFTTTWYQAADMRPILRSEAAPAAGGVIPISNLHQLQLIGADLTGSYRLSGDIDAGATASTDASAGIWGAGGFVPIGARLLPFTGSLDGAGRTISGLTIDRQSDMYVALIAALGSTGSVSDVGLLGGSISGYGYVAALVGRNSGSVVRSYSTTHILGHDYYVGGLVGLSSTGATISQSYATGGVVNDLGQQTGGLVGSNDGGSINDSYATGSVSGQATVGGLIGGGRAGSIVRSYATGSVAGTSDVGGLVGRGDPTVSQAYASGHVSGTGNVGGVAGLLNGGSLTSVFWDTDTSAQPVAVGNGGNAGATGLTTAQSRATSYYSGFDFTNTWYQAADMRPILRGEAATAVGGVILVSNLHQLQLMGADLTGSYRLTGNIDATATNGGDASGIWGAGGFVPVGGGGASFTGALNGGGHVVTNLSIVRPASNDVGLIGSFAASNSTRSITDIGLVGGSVSGATDVGALVGYAGNGTIARSYATTNVIGSGYNGGGLVGYAYSATIDASYATGSVSGVNNVGGLVGWMNGGSVSRSYATGSVSGTYSIGGLVGTNFYGSVTNAYATGSASGSSVIGGLVGTNYDVISMAYATGTVSGGTAGGLIGANYGTAVSAVWNTQTSGRANAIGNSATSSAVGLTTAQMQDLAAFRTNYAGFDFATIWSPPNQVGQNNGSVTAYYPQLYALSNVVAVTPGATRTYGAAVPVGSYAGVQAGDYVTTLGTFTTTAVSTSDVGTYPIGGSGAAASSTAGRSYRTVYAPASLTVTPATITVAGASGVNKTYDGTTALPGGNVGFTSTGVLFGDAVAISAAAATYDSADAGSRSVLVSGLALSGAEAGNYVLSGTSVTGSGTIGKAVVTVAGAAGVNKIYDGTTALPAGSAGFTSTGILLGDAVAISAAAAAYDNANAGNRSVLVSGLALSGAKAGNYMLSGTAVTGSGTISPATLTYVADAASRPYGAANPALTGTIAGFVAGQTQASATTGTSTFGTAATAASNAGLYAVNGSGLAANNGNYVFAQAAGNATAFSITPALLSVTGARAYDGTTGFASPALVAGGAMNGETVSVIAGNGTSAAAGAGTYAGSPLSGLAITVTGGNAAASNYQLPTSGVLTISPRGVTVTANALGRAYGDPNPALTYTVGGAGLVNGDTLGGSLATGATMASNVDNYAITQGSLANTNYAIAYTGALLTVSPRTLTVTANALGRSYGDPNPTLTYTVGGAGLVNGDTLGGSLATGATMVSNVGSYAITRGSLANANYAIAYTGASLAVTPRALIVTASDRSKIYGNALTLGTTAFTTGPGQLVNGDGIASVTLASDGAAANAPVVAGGYGISVSAATGNGLGNYAIGYRPGMLSVAPRALTVLPDAVSRIYGNANAASGTATGDALVNGDTIASVTLTTPATAASGIGGYALTGAAAIGTGLGNYAIGYATRDNGLTVTARPITVAAGAQARAYGDPNPTLGYTVGGAGLVNGDVLSGALATSAAPSSGIGNYAIAQGNLAASANYRVGYTGAALTVTPRSLLIVAADQVSLFGSPTPALTYTVGGAGLVSGDVLTGTLATRTPPTGPGSYAIIQGTLAAPINYAVAFTPATLTVVPSQVAPSATQASSVVRDSFATDTRPLSDAGLLADTRDGNGPDAGASGDALLASPVEAMRIVCPRKQTCTTMAQAVGGSR